MVIARSVVSAIWDVCTHTSTTLALHLATLWHWLSSLVAPRTLLAAQTQSHWCWASPLALNPHCSQGECWRASAEWVLSDLEASTLAVNLPCPLWSSDYRTCTGFMVHGLCKSASAKSAKVSCKTCDINGYIYTVQWPANTYLKTWNTWKWKNLWNMNPTKTRAHIVYAATWLCGIFVGGIFVVYAEH